MNCDSRFLKNPEFVIYYLWQKEMRELSAGIYNVLNSTGKRHVSVKEFVDGINDSDAGIEVNLSTQPEAPNNSGTLRRVMSWQW